MKKITLLMWGCSLYSVVASPLRADPLPHQQSDLLSIRENRLDNLLFHWKVTERTTRTQPSQLRVERLQSATRAQYPKALRKMGLTDEARIKRIVEGEVQDVPKMMQGGVTSNTMTWSFARRGEETLVTSHSRGDGLQEAYTYYYRKNDAIIINNSTLTATGNKVQIDAPVAWSCPGDSLRYRQPIRPSLPIAPEQLAVFMGLNPLRLYDTHWKVISEDPSAWVIEMEGELGVAQKFTERITLKKNYDAAPDTIEIVEPNKKITLHALSYKNYKGIWICNKASFTDTTEGIQTIRQIWTLADVMPSQSFRVLGPPHLLVNDYRILGASVSTKGLLIVPDESQSNGLVHYLWGGDFPSLTELKRMQEEQHPGEAVPDPGQSISAPVSLSTPAARSNLVGSTLPFAGGLLCIIGGVWMFMHRRAA